MGTSYVVWKSVSASTHQWMSEERVKNKGETFFLKFPLISVFLLWSHPNAIWLNNVRVVTVCAPLCLRDLKLLHLPVGGSGHVALYRTQGPFLHHISLSTSPERVHAGKPFVLVLSGHLAACPDQPTGQQLFNRQQWLFTWRMKYISVSILCHLSVLSCYCIHFWMKVILQLQCQFTAITCVLIVKI